MGLFGRDEQSPYSQPIEPQPTSRSTAPREREQKAGTSNVTIIAASCRVEGTLTGSGDVTIEGVFSGEVDGMNKLLIAEGGTAKATLHARNIVVAGKIKGNVSADEKIELRPTAVLHGNIMAPRILIQEGATFEGQVFMKKPPEKPPAGQAKGQPLSGPGDASQTAKPADENQDKQKQENDKGKGGPNKG